jgi:hypothetical protein
MSVLPPSDLELQTLEHALQAALPPVAPRAAYVANLKTRLLTPAPHSATDETSWFWWAAGLVGVIAAFLSWRSWKAQTVKSVAH